MHKYLRGYITVEASYVMPIILMIYYVLIMGGFYLYDRCVVSQDAFLIALRGSRFTFASDNYGEVIYAEESEAAFGNNYMKERLSRKSLYYPFLEAEVLYAEKNAGETKIYVSGFNGALDISKTMKIQNPLQKVKKIRRANYGS